MGQVDITVNGKIYRIACEDGEEERLGSLAGIVDAHVHELVEQVGNNISDSRLLVMASLLIADELMDLRDSRDETVDEDDADGVGELSPEEEESLAAAIDAVSGRIEALTDQFARSR